MTGPGASRTGAYLLSGHDGAYAVERFSCGDEPDGWRYVGRREDPATGEPIGTIDLLLDPAGRALRLEILAGGWQLRGGVVGPDALWRRGEQERSVPAHGFTGTSPAYAVAAARLAAAGGSRLRLVSVHDGALATSTVDQDWRRLGDGSWECSDLATGQRGLLQIAGDVVRAGPGLTLLDPDTLLADLGPAGWSG